MTKKSYECWKEGSCAKSIIDACDFEEAAEIFAREKFWSDMDYHQDIIVCVSRDGVTKKFECEVEAVPVVHCHEVQDDQ